MPYRQTPFVSGQVYHVFNRSVAKEPILVGQKDCQRFLEVTDFYRFQKPGVRFSHYNHLASKERNNYLASLYKTANKLVEILAFAIMPNHFHFLLRQLETKGISIFLRNIENSYAKYLNTKIERTGALFQSMFKAVRMESDEQLLHVARYIHLNPLSSYVLKTTEELENYPWTSYIDYLGKRHLSLLETETVLSFFKSVDNLRQFTNDQVEYQRTLSRIKHLCLE